MFDFRDGNSSSVLDIVPCQQEPLQLAFSGSSSSTANLLPLPDLPGAEEPKPKPNKRSQPRLRLRTKTPVSSSRATGSAKSKVSKANRTKKIIKASTKSKDTATRKTQRSTCSRTTTQGGKRQNQDNVAEVNTMETSFVKTPLETLFHWPKHLMNIVAKMKHDELDSKDCSKPLHIQLWTEFSGCGTAEFALDAITSAAQNNMSMRVMSQCDWDNAARTALINNSGPDSHIFGNIQDVCSSEMLAKTSRKVAVEVFQLKQTHFVLCLSFFWGGGQGYVQ